MVNCSKQNKHIFIIKLLKSYEKRHNQTLSLHGSTLNQYSHYSARNRLEIEPDNPIINNSFGKMKKQSKLTQEVFDRIKELIKLKVPSSIITKIMDKSYFTICYVKKADSLADYFRITAPKVKKEVQPVVEQAKPLKPSMDEHNSIVVLLRAIIHNQEVMIELLK